jgi:hypothetical protein
MKKIFILCLLINKVAFGQLDKNDHFDLIGITFNSGVAKIKPTAGLSKIKGNMYFENKLIGSDNWFQGELLLPEGRKVKEVLIRYNIYQDIVEVKQKEDILSIRSEKIKGFTLQATDGKVNTFLNGFTTNHNSKINYFSYFEILHDGKYKLLAKHQKVILKDNTPSHLTAELNNSYSKVVKYFLINSICELQPISLNKKAFFALFGYKANKVQMIVKDNKINIRKQQDLIRLFEILNATL